MTAIPTKQHHHHTTIPNTPDGHTRQESNGRPRLSVFTIRRLTITTHVLVALVMGQVKLIAQTSFGYTGITLPQLTHPDSQDLVLTPQEATYFGSLRMLGWMLGGLVSGPLMVRLGQRTTLLLGMFLTIATWIVLAFTPVTWLLLCTMFIHGIATSLTVPSVSTYTTEVTHEKYRGATFSFITLVTCLGVLLPTFIGVTGINWRLLALILGSLPLFSLTGVFFLPNSPRWLVSRGRISDAQKALIFFRGSHLNPEAELEVIVAQINSEKKIGVLQQVKLLLKPETRRMVCSMNLMFLLFGCCGIASIQAYLMPILLETELAFDPYVTAVIYSCMRMAGAFVPIFLVDWLGRKPLLVFSFLVTSMCYASLGISEYLSKSGISGVSTWLTFGSVIVLGFMIGIMVPVMSTLEGEMIPAKSRAVGVLFLHTCLSVANFLSIWLYPSAVRVVGQPVVFGFFSVCCVAIVLISLTLPETKGLALEQITASNTT